VLRSSLLADYTKTQLPREELRDVIDLSLWSGQLLLQHGADSQRIEETVHRMGTALGANWLDILVSPNAIVVTTISGDEFRTKLRRVVRIGVNMTILDRVNQLSREVVAGEMDRFELRDHLEAVDHLPHYYNRWMIVGMVGLACAAFARLFGADLPVMLFTWAASSAAMFTRQELAKRHFNAFLVVIATALVAGLVASLATRLDIGQEPQLALAASVLLLVPGVPLINAAEDLINGHLVTGIVRGVTGGLIALCIALGLVIAMRLMGVAL
jgi:uncharacterized membrane protein YjjP (DUF1212 family)